MTAVRVPDVLLRVSPLMLERYNSLVVMGAGRGRAKPVPFTFARADATTCATYIDRDGLVRTAAANKLRIEWVDLDGDGIRETPGLLLEGSRTNLIENSDYEVDIVGSNVPNATPTLSRDNAQARSGSWSLKIITNAASRSGHYIQNRNGTRIAVVAGTTYTLTVWSYAPAASVGKPWQLQTDWYDAVPALISTTTPAAVNLVAGWQRLTYTVTAPTGAVTVDLFSGSTDSTVFTIWEDVPQFEAATFASSAIPTGTGAVTRAADSLTVPFNFGPMDLTVLARVARPVHADVSGALGITPGVYQLGSTDGNVRVVFLSGSRTIEHGIDTAGTDAFPGAAVPAGNPISMAIQYQDFATGPKTRIDVGSGYGALSGAVSALTAFTNQTLIVGFTDAGADYLYGVLLDLVIARGLFTKAEMEAVP